MPIKIRQLEPTDNSNWDSYVNSHPEGSFFHLISWKKIIEKTFGHKSYYLIAEQQNLSSDINPQIPITNSYPISSSAIEKSETINIPHYNNTIVGILPLFSIKSFLFGKYLVSIPFSEIGGALADNNEIENLLINKAIEITKKYALDYLELRYVNKILDGFKLKSLYYNFKREIFNDLDQNLKAIPRKARRMIRQGQKYNLSFELGKHNLKEYYWVLSKSYHNLGTPPFSYKLFENICKELGDKSLLLLVRNRNKIPIAGVLSFFYKDQLLPYYAGSLVEYREQAPNDYMYWQLMEYGCKNGYKIFDFGRSKEGTGSFNFKRHWGFEPKPLHYQYYLNAIKEIPNLSPVNPKYKKKIECWKKLPFKATKIIGPPIAKYLA